MPTSPGGTDAITGWNRAPGRKSLSGETAAGRRSSFFGLMTISGLQPASPWPRSRWKMLAGVEGFTIRTLSRAAICR